MQSNQNATVQVLESPLATERVEVMLEPNEGTPRVILRYSTWTDGLGWCSQKTIHLASQQLDELHRAVTVARHRVNRHRAEVGHVQESNNVIQLPTLA